MLTGGLLALTGCGGSSHVVTKTVTSAATASTPTPPPAPAPRPAAAPSAATSAFAATLIAADALQGETPVGDAVFGPAEVAAGVTVVTATGTTSSTVTAPPAPNKRVVAGHASGEYAVAYTNGTFRRPSQITLTVSASPAQSGSVDWNVVCFEDSGGVGREEGHSTMQLPTTKSLPLPAPSVSCIGSADVQLSKTGTVTISLTG